MFRRVEATLPPDPTYPADLKKLGYFINKGGQVRKIAHPEESFQFHHTNDPRHNEVHREAMQECQRQEVLARFAKLGLNPLYFSDCGMTFGKPKNKPHVPILSPPLNVLKESQRVILVINDTLQDLGILAYRDLQRDAGLNGGSIVNFTKEMVKRMISDELTEEVSKALSEDNAAILDSDKHIPALVVTNTGQQYYSWKFNRPMTLRSWDAMPRKSICHTETMIHPDYNLVPGHRDPKEHIKTVLDQVITNEDIVPKDASVYVIGIENGGQYLLEILDKEWTKYGSRINALALIQSGCSPETISNPQLTQYLRDRAREWRVASIEDSNVCMAVPGTGNELAVKEEATYGNPDSLCPTFSAGPACIGECIFPVPEVYKAILDFFEEVDKSPSGYKNPKFKVHTPPSEAEMDEKLGLEPVKSAEQVAIEEKKEQIAHMKLSLAAIPEIEELMEGLANTERRIQKYEKELEELIEAEQAARTGPKMTLANQEVDVDLVRDAGLLD